MVPRLAVVKLLCASGRFGLGLDGGDRLYGADLDPARLLLLRHQAFEVDVQQAIFKACTAHLHILRQLETALERASGDALVEIGFAVCLGLCGVVALHGQHAFAHFDGQVAFAETGDRQRDPVVVLVGPLDVIGG